VQGHLRHHKLHGWLRTERGVYELHTMVGIFSTRALTVAAAAVAAALTLGVSVEATGACNCLIHAKMELYEDAMKEWPQAVKDTNLEYKRQYAKSLTDEEREQLPTNSDGSFNYDSDKFPTLLDPESGGHRRRRETINHPEGAPFISQSGGGQCTLQNLKNLICGGEECGTDEEQKDYDELYEECTKQPGIGEQNEIEEMETSSPASCAAVCSKCGCGGFDFHDADECFPADATVEREDGSKVAMTDLKVGDKVRVSPTEFSEVFMFTHQNIDVQAAFVKISVAGVQHPLRVTAGHYVYVNGKLQTARTVNVGDALQTAAGVSANVTAVGREWSAGLFNPHTLHGDVVVDGVLTSTYTESVSPSLAHALLWPLRALYGAGVAFKGGGWEGGGGSWAEAAAKLGLRGDQRYPL